MIDCEEILPVFLASCRKDPGSSANGSPGPVIVKPRTATWRVLLSI
jgi:hypothetical protein